MLASHARSFFTAGPPKAPMTDLFARLHRHPLSRPFARALGLPDPVELLRADGGYDAQPFAGKRIVLIAGHAGYASAAIATAIEAGGGRHQPLLDGADGKANIVVLDATGCRTPADLQLLYDAFHPLARRIATNGRVLIVATPPAAADTALAAASAWGIEGFARSLGKELGRKGITVNLAQAAQDAVERLAGPVRFFCGPQTTYVSGQVVHVTAQVPAPAALPASQVLAGKVALVTGSARGIGMATAERLAQEGATVVCLDVAAASQQLHETCRRIGATALVMDIAAPETPAALLRELREKFGGVDIVVHNAGITRDRTLANMPERDWQLVLDINLAAIAAIDEALLGAQVLRDFGRIVCLSSISGIAGNVGQANYATSKAALIGYVAARAPELARRGIAINAVAPGFIETPMTEAMPFATREIGRRLNALKQGGRPRDAAELIAFLATPGAYGITGQTIRVCGQGLIGA